MKRYEVYNIFKVFKWKHARYREKRKKIFYIETKRNETKRNKLQNILHVTCDLKRKSYDEK